MFFKVIDPGTGEEPNMERIALDDGYLLLMDDCGNVAYPPAGRFLVVEINPDNISPCLKK